MRYLTLSKTGYWQFRLQIPKPHRELFSNKSEFKKSLGKITSETAKLLALQLEFDIRRQCSHFVSSDHHLNIELTETT
ncbi:hypothetical protein N9R79_05990 [Vibrio sp.]|nr:hypothetical protein [Vibrio sp.]